MRSFLFPRCGIIFSSALIVIGLFFLFIFPSIFQFYANKEFILSRKSQSFKHWRRTPIPLIMDVYFFNWTNPEEINLKDKKPSFTQLGPYRFYETREKVNLTWNENNTITYRQLRTWHFNPEESNGSPDDMITTLNPIGLTAATQWSDRGNFIFDMAMSGFSQEVSVTHSLQQLLFDGYKDNLVSLANIIDKSPFDKFGWMYRKNASYAADGWFNMETGAEDTSRLGRLSSWNHKNHTGESQGSCDKVTGFTGDMFPPGLIGRNSKLHIFSQELCRSLPLSYEMDVEVRGILGQKFTTGLHEVDAGTSCEGISAYTDLVNMTACGFGTPVFVSLPHFYRARPFHLKKLKGLRPNRKDHEFFATIEPTFGIPINVRARAQLNLHLKPYSEVSLYRNVPDMMFPILWLDQQARITEPLARELRTVILVPEIASVVGVFSLSLGTLLFLITAVLLRLDGKVTKTSDMPVTLPDMPVTLPDMPMTVLDMTVTPNSPPPQTRLYPILNDQF